MTQLRKVLNAIDARLHTSADINSALDLAWIEPTHKLHKTFRAMFRNTVFEYAPKCCFESDSVVDKIIEYSGQSVRQLLLILSECCLSANTDVITDDDVNSAIIQIGADFRRFLTPDDYAILLRVNGTTNAINTFEFHIVDDRVAFLSRNEALFTYYSDTSSYVKYCANPIVKTLYGYTSRIKKGA